MPDESKPSETGQRTIEQAIDGKVYSLDYSDWSGVELRDFRVEVGVPLPIASALAGQQIDLVEFYGAVKWIIDRRENPKLRYEHVLAGMTYDSLTSTEEEQPSPPD